MWITRHVGEPLQLYVLILLYGLQGEMGALR